ncbi:MAG: ABC transporter permease [Desulfotignum sp.]|nr:ABC transporter permease [Desulfotignum sp.]
MKLYNICLGNIKRRKTRMLFLALGLIIGIGTVVTLLSITESMSRDIEERLDQFGANIVMAPRMENLSLNYGGIDVGGVNYEVRELDQASLSRIHTIENAKNLGVIAPKILGPVTIMDKTLLLMGVVFEEELALKPWWQKTGAFPGADNELLLGSAAASLLNASPGSTLVMKEQSFKVSGVLDPTGGSEDNAVIAGLAPAQKILGKQGKISLVEISAFCRGCPITELTLQIAEKFPNAKVTAMKQAVMSKMQSIELFKSFSLGVSALVITIGALLVMVTMMGSVNQRTREIGIFRAIGFRQGHVMQIILLEALLLGIFGGLAGFVLGNGVARIIIPLTLEAGRFAGINWQLGGICLLLSAALSLLASLYPAFKAASLDPNLALRAL